MLLPQNINFFQKLPAGVWKNITLYCIEYCEKGKQGKKIMHAFVCLLAIVLLSFPPAEGCNAPTNQVSALNDLYTATNGKYWKNNKNWGDGDPCSRHWFGITCSAGNCDILYLDLPSNNLTGSLPSSLNELTGVELIKLQTNHLIGSIPSDFLNSADTVNLSGNQLSGTIPPLSGILSLLSLSYNKLSGSIQFLGCTYLELLELENNSLSGTIPSGMCNCANLTNINLSRNNFTGTVPCQPTSFPEITSLYLSNNNFSGSLPSWMFSSGIEEIILSNNQFTGTISAFDTLISLNTLNLGYNQLEGSIPVNISNCRALSQLYLNNNNLVGSIPSLANIPHLQYLIMNNNKLNGSIPSDMHFTSLKILNLSHNELQGTIPSGIGNYSSALSELYLNNNNLTGAIPPSMTHLTSLQAFSINSNSLNGTIFMFNSTRLKSADFSENQFCGLLPEMFWKPTVKYSFNVSHNLLECPLPPYCTYKQYGGNENCTPCNPQSLLLNYTVEAMIAISSGNANEAFEKASSACNLQEVIKPVSIVGETLYNISCQMTNNLNNSMTLKNRRYNAVSQNQWSYYQTLVKDYLGSLETAESNLKDYYNNIGDQQILKQLVSTAINSNEARLSNWIARSEEVHALMSNITLQMEILNREIVAIATSLVNPVQKLSQDVSADLQKIYSNIPNMNSTYFVNSMTEIMMTVGGQICCYYSLVDNDQVAQTIFNQTQTIYACMSKARAYFTGINTLLPLYENVYNIAMGYNSSRSLMRYYSKYQKIPYVLPKSYLNVVEVHEINSFIEYYIQRLENIASQSNVDEAIQNLGQYADNFISLSFDWYHLAMILQLSESQADLLEQTAEELSSIFDDQDLETVALRHGFGLLWLQKASLQMISVMYLLDETRQLGYASLTNISYSIPYNPSSSQLQSIQTMLDTEISSEEKYSDSSSCWTNFTVTADLHPHIFKQLWATGNATIYVPIPSIENTKFYQVNMLNLAVVPSPVVALEYMIGVEAVHIGLAQFYDHSFNLWNYTFNPVLYDYYFYSDSDCPVSQPYQNPNYIHYSPYGPWILAFDTNTINVKNITSIELFFKLAWNVGGGNPNSDFFNANGRVAGCIPQPKNCN